MAITIPKPLIPVLTKPMTPPWVLALVLTTQLVYSQIGNDPIPSCILKFEQLHYSTSVKENRGIDAIKLNLKSVCNVSQKYTVLEASMKELKNGKPSLFYMSGITRTTPIGKSQTEANFLDFWQRCKRGKVLALRGEAHGTVYLRNGKQVAVNGYTGEFTPVHCEFKAK